MKQSIIAIVFAIGASLLTSASYFNIQKDKIVQPETITVETEQSKPEKLEQSPKREAPSLEDFQASLIDVIADAKMSVVSIIATKDISYIYAEDAFDFFRGRGEQQVIRQPQEIGGGSGIYASKGGYIITNKHVVDDSRADYSVIFSDGSTAEVEKARLDPVIDIAVLKIDPSDIPSGANPADFISFEEEVKVGSLTIAIGNTLNEFQNSVTLGIVSGRNRKLLSDAENVYAGLYQTDTAISQGNSGGPLIRVDGKTIGVNTAVSSEGNDIGFSIPITQEFVDATLDSVKSNDAIERPFIGIQYLDIDRRVQAELKLEDDQGVIIMQVVPNTAASEAGIQKDDIIVAIDGKTIDEKNPFLYQLFVHQPGDTITFTVKRDGKLQSIDVTLRRNNRG